MGWLWRSDPQTPPAPTPFQPSASARDVDKPAANAKPLTREEQADAELKAFLSELEASTRSPSEHDSASIVDAATPTPAASGTASTNRSLYPTTMSCRDAFDAAFYCQSLGGQFNNVYRYGTLRSCSEHWNDFWFCMRTKSYGDADKAKVVGERYREKERKYREGPSSEDVWEERKPGEELRNAFMKDPDEVDIPGLPKRKMQTE